nr:cell division coordinator CpoB [uncultured bacterium]
MAQKPMMKKSGVEDPHQAQALQNYEAGLRAMQEHKFDKAKGLFQKAIESAGKELADRARVHMNTCTQRAEQPSHQFKTPEEHYDYAISLMNVGDYVGAREHLEKLQKQSPKADYVLYGLAALNCLTGHVEDALRYLGESIQANRSVRFQARNDSDFQSLNEDPRFTELLYPEVGSDELSSAETGR